MVLRIDSQRYVSIASVVSCVLFSLSACSPSPPKPGPVGGERAAPFAAAGGSEAHLVTGKTMPGAIVLLEPRTPREFPDQARPPLMDQVSQTFTPDVLFVRTGQPVGFRNSDDLLHNVNVRDDETKEQAFNVAIPGGAVYMFTFKRDGLYNVRCDIHPAMAALVVASASPYTTAADAEGHFTFSDVVPGAYTATVYAGTSQLTKDVDVSAPRTAITFDN